MSGAPSPTIELFSSAATGSDTFVVLGAARGGTSMVAGVLRLLGVPMGEDIDPGNNEDREFLSHRGRVDLFSDPSQAGRRKTYVKEIEALIGARNRDYPSWGWKDPAASYYLDKIAGALREPRFLFVTRDPGAVASRRMADRIEEGRNGSAERHAVDDLRAILGQYDGAARLFSRLKRPVLLISYERSLRRPDALIEAIAKFGGLALPENSTDRAKLEAYVTPDRVSGDIAVSSPRRESPRDEDDQPRPEFELRIAKYNGEYADRRARMHEAAQDLEMARSSDPAELASALTEAMCADRQEEAEILAFRLLCVLAVEDGRLILHPRVLCAALSEPGSACAPPMASLALFDLGMLALASGKPADAYWALTAARFAIEKAAAGTLETPFLAPWWALLFNQALAARLCGGEVEARTNCARIVHARTLGLPMDLFALRREPEEYDSYRLLAETQLAEMTPASASE